MRGVIHDGHRQKHLDFDGGVDRQQQGGPIDLVVRDRATTEVLLTIGTRQFGAVELPVRFLAWSETACYSIESALWTPRMHDRPDECSDAAIDKRQRVNSVPDGIGALQQRWGGGHGTDRISHLATRILLRRSGSRHSSYLTGANAGDGTNTAEPGLATSPKFAKTLGGQVKPPTI